MKYEGTCQKLGYTVSKKVRFLLATPWRHQTGSSYSSTRH